MFLYFLLPFFFLLLGSCASSKKFVDENKEEEKVIKKEVRFEKETVEKEIINTASLPVRILTNDSTINLSFTVDTPLKISAENKTVAIVNNGNGIKIQNESGKLSLSINGNIFYSDVFNFSSAEDNTVFFFNGKKYRGSVIVSAGNKIINVVPLEDYLKGVLPAEMPLGKNDENFEALKAFAICARTYTMMKLNENKPDFDLYIDVRDQVYGGVEREKDLSNKAIAATTGMILEYGGKPAGIFYHASCGGYTEDGGNVFSGGNKPYLSMIKDGDEPYCSITPRFEWEEKYPLQEFVSRLSKAGLINSDDFRIESIGINSRFISGRVNEIEINLISDSSGSKDIKIYGNQIRSIIRTGDNKGILRSTMFNINADSDSITITGKGYGHGVGLCQWGAISQSRQGIGYLQILRHYFPGTEVSQLKIKN
ncbi:MAG: SpoIID/LytB domain-containing protein [Ignavibacteriaceae bacterium]